MALSLFGGGATDPFSQMDRMLNQALRTTMMPTTWGGQVGTMPSPGDMWTTLAGSTPMDIVEKDDAYEVVADAPGMNPEEITVECADGVLTIRGAHREKHEDKDKKGRVFRSERVMRSFTRSFGLPENASEDDISASLDKGVLKVCVKKLPETAKPQPKRITVTPGAGTQAQSITAGTTGATGGDVPMA